MFFTKLWFSNFLSKMALDPSTQFEDVGATLYKCYTNVFAGVGQGQRFWEILLFDVLFYP